VTSNDIYKNPKTKSSQKVLRLFLAYTNRFLKYLDFTLSLCLLLLFTWFLVYIDGKCINTNCNIEWISLKPFENIPDFINTNIPQLASFLSSLKIVYNGTFFELINKFFLSFFTTLGLIRVGLTFFLNKKEEGLLEGFFYGGLCIFAFCFLLITKNSDQFIYISAPNNTVHAESGVVTFTLILLISGALMLFKDKKNWDRASFFTKYRLIYYCILLVVFVINVNFGILLFLISIPVNMHIDMGKRNHLHYEHPKWMSEDLT
jgi:hypothetical protein